MDYGTDFCPIRQILCIDGTDRMGRRRQQLGRFAGGVDINDRCLGGAVVYKYPVAREQINVARSVTLEINGDKRVGGDEGDVVAVITDRR